MPEIKAYLRLTKVPDKIFAVLLTNYSYLFISMFHQLKTQGFYASTYE